MKKQVLFLLALILILSQTAAFSKGSYVSSPTRMAIKKYKMGNYTGCLQDCMNIVVHDPSNALAYYYMAISYAQAGNKDEAVKAYGKVLGLSPNPALAGYASTGKRCLEDPDKCHQDTPSGDPDLDKFVAGKNNMVSDKVKKDFAEKALNNIKNDANNGRDIDNFDMQKINDYTRHRSDVETDNKIAQNKPTDAEIVAALRVLKEAGLNPYEQAQAQAMPQQAVLPQNTAANAYPQMANSPQTPDLNQLNMLMGVNNQQNNTNSALNMLPYMMMQNKDGSNNYSPQLMQAVIMNSMMPNLNFDLDKDK